MTTKTKPFLTDIKELRRRAQADMGQGAVVPGQESEAKSYVAVLNQILASEIVCVLRYQRHYYMAEGIHAEPVKAEFREHWLSEQSHVEKIAERIVQLNGEPDFNPEGLLTRAASEYKPGGSLVSMIQEDLVAERVVIMWYRELTAYFGENDPTTRRVMEELLADEEEHAEDLSSLLKEFEVDSPDSHGSMKKNSTRLSSGDRSSDAL